MAVFKIIANDFNLEATLTSGQVFGFTEKDGHFSGYLRGNGVRFRQDGKTLWMESDSGVELTELTQDYFDLGRDLKPVYRILESEELLRKTLQIFRGLRLIKQDSWEALACVIISSNNNIKRIQGIWKKHCPNVPCWNRSE